MDNMNPIGNGLNFPHFRPLNFRDYRNYLPTAYDNSLSMQESLLQVLNFCNEIGLLNQNMSDNWNMLLGWIKTNGIDEAVSSQLNAWILDGTMAKILDKTALKEVNAKLDDLTVTTGANYSNAKEYADQLFRSAMGDIANISVGVKGAYADLDTLKAQKPNGDTGVYVLQSDGHWYFWNGEDWEDGGLYQSMGIGENSVKYDMRTRMGNIGLIAGGHNLNITINGTDALEKTMVFSGQFFVLDGSKPYQNAGQTFTLTTSIGYIMYNTVTKAIYIASFSDDPANDNDRQSSLMIGVWYANENVYLFTNNLQYSVNGVAKSSYDNLADNSVKYNTRTRMGSMGLLVGGDSLKINIQGSDSAEKTMTFSGQWFVLDGSKPYQNDAKTFTLASNIGYIMYNTVSKAIYIASFSDDPTNNIDRQNSLMIGVWYANNSVYLFTNNLLFTVNGVTHGSYDNHKTIESGRLVSNSELIINTTDKTLTYSGVCVSEDGYIYTVAGSDISNLDTKSPFTLYMDLSDKKLKIVNNATFNDEVAGKQYLMLGLFYALDFNYYTNVSFNNAVMINGVCAQKPNAEPNLFSTKIVAIGDSITAGLTATGGHYTDKPYPYWMGIEYGGVITNVAVSGGCIVGDSNKDFKYQYENVSFYDYDAVVIALGINDYYGNNTINDIKSALTTGIDSMYSQNGKLFIAGLLPQMSFPTSGESLITKNTAGYDLNDLCDALIEVYESYQIPYFDWRKSPIVTRHNHDQVTSDGTHINAEMHKIMGRRVGEFLKLNM